MIEISVINLQKRPFNLDFAKMAVEHVLKKERISNGKVNIVLVDDLLIKQLNKKYRGCDRPTDVLAFPYGGEHGILGEIIISTDMAERQAKEYKHSFGEELLLLLIHGTLHLLGYTHSENYEPLEPMRQKEKAFMDLCLKAKLPTLE